MRQGTGNVLAIMNHSSTHESMDLNGAIYALREGEGADSYLRNKGFEGGRPDFLAQLKMLSACVVLNRWEAREGQDKNHCWVHEEAYYPLPKDIVNHLRSM